MRDCRSDLALARRAASGDQSSWREIYAATSDRLFSLLCYQVEDREEALDLLQETYLQAFRRIDSYRGDAPLEAWLRAIALRKALDWKRRALQRLKRMVSFDEKTIAPIFPSDNTRFSSERAALSRALARLSSHQRIVFLLHEWEEWSFKEISRLLSCKESTVRVHYTRARRRLQAQLKRPPGTIRTNGLEGQPT
jgi:RNA polymerase sigma-70 factor (ECF subfamily)